MIVPSTREEDVATTGKNVDNDDVAVPKETMLQATVVTACHRFLDLFAARTTDGPAGTYVVRAAKYTKTVALY